MTCKDDAIKAVDHQWRGAMEIHKRVGCWSHSGIRSALFILASEYRIEAREVPGRGGHAKLEYRLSEKP